MIRGMWSDDYDLKKMILGPMDVNAGFDVVKHSE